MSEEETRLPCPKCPSSDAYCWNEVKGVGHCKSCGDYSHVRSKGDEPTPIKGQIHRPEEDYLLVHRGYRGIRQGIAEFYNVQTALDDDGNEVRRRYTYPSGGYKERILPKEGFPQKGLKNDQLFGSNLFPKGSKKVLVVTEGEDDCLSAAQMLGTTYCAPVSVPCATPGQKFWQANREYINSFEKIILSVDTDSAGDELANKFASMFPNKVYRIDHGTYKDANAMLTSGKDQEYKSAYFNAKKFVPENILNTTDQFLELFHTGESTTYLPTGVKELDDVIVGLPRGHFTVFQAPEGVGKSEFMRFLEYNILKNKAQAPIAICHMEETRKRSLLGLVSYETGQNTTRDDLITDQGAVEDAIKVLTEDERLFLFSVGVDDDPNSILDQIRYFAEGCGCQYIFFEPIQDLGYSRVGDETLESFLSQLSTRLSRLASELNVGIITVAHENDNGDIRDCRMIGKRASLVIKLERDKMADDPEERNTTTLLVTKNRPASVTGKAGQLTFDPESFTLSAKGQEKPTRHTEDYDEEIPF